MPLYQDDMVWRAVQSYLPYQNRLNEKNMPDEYFVVLSDNNRIHLDVYSREDSKATIILLHGVGGNGRLLSFLAVPLYEQGYEVICPDLPLYGYSEYSGTITYDTWVADGSEITNHYVEKRRPTFVFGLSAGGMLAYQVACQVPLIRGVLATCILDQRQRKITETTSSHPHLVKLALPLIASASRLLPDVKIPMKWVANMKAIVNDTSLAKLLMADQRSSGSKISLAFLHTMLRPDIRIEPADFQIPFLLLHPQNDRWTDLSLSRLFYDQLRCEKELHILNGAGHFPIEEEGLDALVRHSIAFIERNLRLF